MAQEEDKKQEVEEEQPQTVLHLLRQKAISTTLKNILNYHSYFLTSMLKNWQI